jgi:hypothetical protein
MPGWRRRKCIGDITATIAATITIIIGGIAGTTTIIAITTIIIVTGTAGDCGSLMQMPTGPLHRGPVSISAVALKLARLPPVISDISFS